MAPKRKTAKKPAAAGPTGIQRANRRPATSGPPAVSRAARARRVADEDRADKARRAAAAAASRGQRVNAHQAVRDTAQAAADQAAQLVAAQNALAIAQTVAQNAQDARDAARQARNHSRLLRDAANTQRNLAERQRDEALTQRDQALAAAANVGAVVPAVHEASTVSIADTQPKALCNIEVERQVNFKDSPVNLRAVMDVFPYPNVQTLLRYDTRVYLTRVVPEDSLEEPEEVEIGSLETWRISKQTVAHPNAEQTWFTQTAARPLRADPDADMVEVAKCVRGIFERNLTIQQDIQPPGHPTVRRDLLRKALMYIQMFMIEDDWRGGGLMRPTMHIFHELLPQLPEWFAFRGMVVLVPGKPHGDAYWAAKTPKEAAEILAGMYTRCGGYTDWHHAYTAIADGYDEAVLIMMGREIL